jgi:hypothetical protein
MEGGQPNIRVLAEQLNNAPGGHRNLRVRAPPGVKAAAGLPNRRHHFPTW